MSKKNPMSYAMVSVVACISVVLAFLTGSPQEAGAANPQQYYSVVKGYRNSIQLYAGRPSQLSVQIPKKHSVVPEVKWFPVNPSEGKDVNVTLCMFSNDAKSSQDFACGSVGKDETFFPKLRTLGGSTQMRVELKSTKKIKVNVDTLFRSALTPEMERNLVDYQNEDMEAGSEGDAANATATASPSITPSMTASSSVTPSMSASSSMASNVSASPSTTSGAHMMSNSPTASVSPTETPSSSETPSTTSTASSSPSAGMSGTPSKSVNASFSSTRTPTETPSESPSSTETPSETASSSATAEVASPSVNISPEPTEPTPTPAPSKGKGGGSGSNSNNNTAAIAGGVGGGVGLLLILGLGFWCCRRRKTSEDQYLLHEGEA